MNFKKRVNGSWTDIPHYVHKTATDTITTLPAVIYPNAATATVGLKGNMQQTGTPTPTNPIQPQECGDLETSGTKAGQYKIPISSASTTTPVYLGEVETTRKIKKLVLTGEESSWYASSGFMFNDTIQPDYLRSTATTLICSHYKAIRGVAGGSDVSNGQCALYRFPSVQRLYIRDNNYTTAENFKTYLQQQYAAGTPVTIWYVLATPETAVVNEPLRKIGDYADGVSNISIPVTAGGDTISVDTTLQPSEVTVNYKGWHSVADVHERDNGAWI